MTHDSVTLAYDDKTPEQLKQAIDDVGVQPAKFPVSTIAVGNVGPYGTVLRGQDIAVYHIQP